MLMGRKSVGSTNTISLRNKHWMANKPHQKQAFKGLPRIEVPQICINSREGFDHKLGKSAILSSSSKHMHLSRVSRVIFMFTTILANALIFPTTV